jgi:hypothetical protein
VVDFPAGIQLTAADTREQARYLITSTSSSNAALSSSENLPERFCKRLIAHCKHVKMEILAAGGETTAADKVEC